MAYAMWELTQGVPIWLKKLLLGPTVNLIMVVRFIDVTTKYSTRTTTKNTWKFTKRMKTLNSPWEAGPILTV